MINIIKGKVMKKLLFANLLFFIVIIINEILLRLIKLRIFFDEYFLEKIINIYNESFFLSIGLILSLLILAFDILSNRNILIIKINLEKYELLETIKCSLLLILNNVLYFFLASIINTQNNLLYLTFFEVISIIIFIIFIFNVINNIPNLLDNKEQRKNMRDFISNKFQEILNHNKKEKKEHSGVLFLKTNEPVIGQMLQEIKLMIYKDIKNDAFYFNDREIFSLLDLLNEGLKFYEKIGEDNSYKHIENEWIDIIKVIYSFSFENDIDKNLLNEIKLKSKSIIVQNIKQCKNDELKSHYENVLKYIKNK